MNDHFDIFKRLCQYEVEPPPGVLLRIVKSLDNADMQDSWDDISLQGSMVQLQELEVNAPQYLLPFIEGEITSSSRLYRLKEIEINPPANAFALIMEKLKADNPKIKTRIPIAKILSLHPYKSVAAAVILVAIGWLIYMLAGSTDKEKKEVVRQAVIPVIPVEDSASTTNIAVLKKDKPDHVYGSGKTFISDDFFYKRKISVDDYKFALIDNDVLTTFAGYTYSAIPVFIRTSEGNSFRIKTDQYSDIIVSETMSKMIKDMNQFRNNKKLTRRARRERGKLERWKKADIKRFDKPGDKNPLDPIDLAEFVF